MDSASHALDASASVQLLPSIIGLEGVRFSFLTSFPIFRTSQSLFLQSVLASVALLLKTPSSLLPVSSRFFSITLH